MQQEKIKMNDKCNHDCFNCIFDDCILDELERDKKPRELKTNKRAVYMRDYYEKNKAKQLEKAKAYYWSHREEISAKRRKKTKEEA